MLHLIEKAENNHDLTREELILLLEDTGCSEELFAAADRVRKKYVGDETQQANNRLPFYSYS